VPFGIGATELIIVLVIVLIIFGPKKLPQLGRSLGGGLREFKNSVSGKGGDDDDEPDVIEGPDRSNVATAAAADDEETETARRQREAKTADAS
jgi:sec-independent protein translocase protein TatA